MSHRRLTFHLPVLREKRLVLGKIDTTADNIGAWIERITANLFVIPLASVHTSL